MTAAKFFTQLDSCLANDNLTPLRTLLKGFVPLNFSGADVQQALDTVRQQRLFPELELLATAFLLSGETQPQLRRQLAQALIEQKRFEQAAVQLHGLRKELPVTHPEYAEANGLLGRLYKQRFVESFKPEHLRAAHWHYQQGWLAKLGDYRWQGINALALQKRAKRAAIELQPATATDELAALLIAEIAATDELKRTSWDMGTAMEACVALGDKREALQWAKLYIAHPDTDAFALGSTLRQLREVWGMDNNPVAAVLDPILQAAIGHLQQGSFEVADIPDDADAEACFEAVFGDVGYTRLEWLGQLILRMQSIGKVVRRVGGKPCGTGFIVDAKALCPRWKSRPVFVTNAHVVNSCKRASQAVYPHHAAVQFTYPSGRQVLDLGEELFYSPASELDIWVGEIEFADWLVPLELQPKAPAVAIAGEPVPKIYVMGHPLGGDASVSLYDNNLVGYKDSFMHYKSPTDPGSSGSPVMNEELEVVALHHMSQPAMRANQGVLFLKIQDAIAELD